MKAATLVAFASLMLTCPGTADACSFAPGYEIAEPPSRIHAGQHTSTLEPPDVSIYTLRRGYGIPDGGSCNDAGILTVRIEGEIAADVAGYTFQLVDGSFPDTAFPDALILPVDFGDGLRGFTFIWLDLARRSTRLTSIDATVAVRQISRSGAESEATLLHFHDPGGSSLARSPE